MRIRKIICVLFVALTILTLFAAAAMATEPSGNWPSTSWTTENRNLKDQDQYGGYNPMYAYYNYGSLFHDAWCSTELSVPSNGYGYVYAEITDSEGHIVSSDLTGSGTGKNVQDGMLKLSAVYGKVNGAKVARFAARQIVGSNITYKRVRWNNNKK